MIDDFAGQVLALAGVMQAAEMAQSSATEGHADAASLEASLRSLYILDPSSAAEVYGGTKGVARGLSLLIAQLRGPKRDPQLLHHVVCLLRLAQQLKQRKEMAQVLAQQLPLIQSQSNCLGTSDDQVLDRLANLYRTTISQLRPRVVVRGNPTHLQHQRIVNAIRATLLAGVRSAVLWDQLGGKRRHLILRRKRIYQQAQALLPGKA